MIAKELRGRAEDVVQMTRRDVAALANQDVQRLVYELQVHQIELEMQNESLRSAHADVEKSQGQYHELFESAPAGYIIVDAAGVIARANIAALSLLGVSLPALLHRPLTAFVVPEDLLILQEHLRSALWDTRASCEVRLKTQDGSGILVRLDTNPVPSRAADCLIVLTDMSERQRSHEALERMNQQLERMNQELEIRVAARTAEVEARNQQLEAEIVARTQSEAKRQELETRLRDAARLESLGLLAGGIAHDFNNLLVSVLGNADLLLLNPGLPDAWLEPLSMIKRAGRGASELTRQLLVIAGRGQVNLASVRLPHVVADSLEHLRGRLSPDVQLQLQITTDLPTIAADRSQVHQVVMNLVINAMEAVDGRGVIAIQTRAEQLDADALSEFQHCTSAQPGNFAILQVQDSGPGIEAADLARIFDPFFTTKFTGRGLGLATVLGIVQSHQGALRVKTSPGAGASFEIAFPLAARRESERPHAPYELTWTGSGSVLLIDDDDAVRQVVAQLLRRLGFDVTAANGGATGLELFRRAQPSFDFVVLDWIMPGFSGEQVLKTLRELAPALPVVLISGYSPENLPTYDDRVVRIQKPMTLAQLTDGIRKVIGEDDAIGSIHRLRPSRTGMD